MELHSNGDRGWWNETKTTVGSFIPGNPFWVLYGTTPPLNLIPASSDMPPLAAGAVLQTALYIISICNAKI